MIHKRVRHKARIIYDILKAIQNGYYKKTQIMQKANLSSNHGEKLLQQVINVGLVATITHEKHILYNLSEKGKQYIQAYERIKRLTQGWEI